LIEKIHGKWPGLSDPVMLEGSHFRIEFLPPIIATGYSAPSQLPRPLTALLQLDLVLGLGSFFAPDGGLGHGASLD